MFCKFCGNQLSDDSVFCNRCGKLVSAEMTRTEPENENTNSVYMQGEAREFHPDNTVYNYMPQRSENEKEDKLRDARGRSILGFAIAGFAFSCTLYFSIIGLIFAIISKVKLGSYIADYGVTRGPATVGRSLGKAGLIISIVFTALLAFIILSLVASS